MSENKFLEGLFSLQGRKALVTGSSSGLGKQIALSLAKAGAEIILHGTKKEKLNAVTEEFQKEFKRKFFSFQADFKLDEVSLHSFEKLIKEHPDIDILVNNAGINLRESWEAVSLASWQKTLDLNVSIPFFLAKAIVPEMINNNFGRIINLASLQSARAFANSMPYGTSKAGISQLTRAMAEAWSRYNITVNAIAPGFFPTPLTEVVFQNEEVKNKNAQQTAIGRNGRMDDINGLVVFLASPASAYITGQTIFLDGGFTAK